ncbi:MAG: hypothetical protein M3Z29_10605 [Pseudomonadota bacterium]|nr:hypothetical protein [Pseudomonadota bacterium]
MHRIVLPALPALPALAASGLCIGALSLSLSAEAQPTTGKPEGPHAAAIEACQRAARQALPWQATPAVDLTFSAPPTVQPSLSSDSQIVLRGVGRWRGAGGMRSFYYNCNVDVRTSEAVGLVMRDVTPAAPESAARPPVEPDLSQLSPTACESSAAEALKERWPRVSQISFDAATRTLSQQSSTRAQLHGSGHALPGPGAPSTLFGFDCEIDPRDGRVVLTSVSG